jgi:O-acetylhomoserine (thiol)-lyase
LDAWRAPPPDQQRCFFGETVTGSDVLDIAAVMAIAHDAGACWWISTLTSPWLIKPFDHGADLVYHRPPNFERPRHGGSAASWWTVSLDRGPRHSWQISPS